MFVFQYLLGNVVVKVSGYKIGLSSEVCCN